WRFLRRRPNRTFAAWCAIFPFGALRPCCAGLVVGFLSVIFVPIGNFDHDIFGAVGDALAAKARLGRDAGSFVELVQLGIGGFVAGLEAFMNDYVAGGAGADAAAGVVESFVEALGDIENAAGQAVVAVGNFFGID